MNHGQISGAAAQTAGYARDAGPTSNLPIPNALTSLSQSISEMGAVAESLVIRLGCVLSPSHPKNETALQSHEKLAAAPPPTSTTADEIATYRLRVQNITAQVQDALNRLEL